MLDKADKQPISDLTPNLTPHPQQTVAVLEHLSGPAIGTETLLYSADIGLALDAERCLTAFDPNGPNSEAGAGAGNLIVRLQRTDGTYHLDAADGPVWINGRQVKATELVHNDIIEFGEKGPLSRFQLIDRDAHSRRYFSDICADCWDYLQTSRKPIITRATLALGGGARRLFGETTILFRAGVIATLVLLALVTLQQNKLNSLQQQQLAASEEQLDRFAQNLARAQKDAITSDQLAEIREGLSRDVSTSLDRLSAIEERAMATETAIGKSAGSVVFLQGAYGFRDKASGQVMRYVVGPTGSPVAGPTGAPLLSLEGEGRIAERRFTGTGFAIADGTILVTNRHVAVPWDSDDNPLLSIGDRLEPFIIKFLVYSPDWTESREAELVMASDTADLALLRLTSGDNPLTPLTIAQDPIVRGRSVIVMGYPTGLRSMVARSGKAFVEELQQDGRADFWNVAQRLADKGFISPLSSYGIVAQVTPDFLVYDAATTQGGSGGPVLNSNGEVIAINAAILPGYDGSNFGVPVEKLNRLITEAGMTVPIASN